MKKYKMIPHYTLNDVSEITLLSVKEAKKLPSHIRANGDWWWLRSPGFAQDYVAYVYYGGDVYEDGNYIYYDILAVRPAFKISNLQSSHRKVLVEDLWCTVADKDLVLADKSICKHRFDSKSNDWESSEIKAYINSEEFKRLIRSDTNDRT